MENESQPILIVYSNGNLQIPGAVTWHEVFRRFKMVKRLGAEMKKQMLAQPVLVEPMEDRPAE